MDPHRVILMILDGWGIAEDPKVSAIDAARKPFFDSCMQQFPHARLRASEEWVGLPPGQMGNSEVGHVNIGAGRVVFQELERITRSLKQGDVRELPAWKSLIGYLRESGKPLHLMGLVSDGGVHSHIGHLFLLIERLNEAGIHNLFIHAFTDGRDTDPHSGLDHIHSLSDFLAEGRKGKIASVCGRYYAMDRDKRWERIRPAYDLLVNGKGESFPDASSAIRASYEKGITDEFIKPAVMEEDGRPVATVAAGDAVLFFNFRTDRARQLTYALTQETLHEHNLHPLPLHFVCMARYDETFHDIQVMFEKEDVRQGLGEVLAGKGKKQIRIAETEKYPHVTFFFNGGREHPFEGEKRILCPSPKVATYDLKPEMSAADIRDAIIPELDRREADFICLNFANPDMVGHTGVFTAAVKAIEAVDACAQAVAEAARRNSYSILITADHGNADKMINPDGSPNTAHTTALVPLILIDSRGRYAVRDGKLGDLAPTILTLMGIDPPAEMTGEVLLVPITSTVS